MWDNVRFFQFFIIVAVIFSSVYAGFEVDFYTERNQHGQSYRVGLTKEYCHNLPHYMDNCVSSVNPHGACVKLYSEPGCKGGYVWFKTYNSHQNLADLDFNNIASSAKLCDDNDGSPSKPPRRTTTTLRPAAYTKRVIFYSGEYQKGTSYVFDLKKYRCYEFPEYVDRKVSSVDTQGACIVLHSKPDCTGWNVRLYPGDGKNHNRLDEHNFDKLASSVQLCD